MVEVDLLLEEVMLKNDKQVDNCVAFVRIFWNCWLNWTPVTTPASTLRSLVSNCSRVVGFRVQIIGRIPSAREISRMRLSISPQGGRIYTGETPVTSLMASRLQASSATTCSLVSAVRGTECDYVCAAMWCPAMYSA